MTMKKIALSVATFAMVASTVYAGTLSVTGVKQTAGAESVKTDKAYYNNVEVNTSYAATINGTVNQGSIIYTFSNVDINSSNAAAYNVWNLTATNTALQVSKNCTNGSKGKVICDINGTITDGDVLVVGENNATATMDFNTSAGYTGTTVGVELTNSATTTIDSGAAVDLITTVNEWSAKVGNKFANTIDASASFLSFKAEANATVVVSQTVPTLGTQTLSAAWSVMPDQNVSTFVTISGTNAFTQGIDNNYTATLAAAGTFNMKAAAIGTTAIKEASFTNSMKATFGTNAVNLITDLTDFGKFTTYGYTGNVAGASYSAGLTDTVISLVNNQTAASADVIVVITDASGSNSCTLTSASDIELTKPSANSTTKYKLSTMLGNSKCSALTGTGYSIQVTLPTTPTNVFANAFVTRTDTSIPSFKVLPVYNNGNSY